MNIDIIDDLKARIILEDLGQQSQENGDEIAVKLNILLPSENGLLHPKLVFGSRLKILGSKLDKKWGNAFSYPGFCYNFKIFKSKTYAEAKKQL